MTDNSIVASEESKTQSAHMSIQDKQNKQGNIEQNSVMPVNPEPFRVQDIPIMTVEANGILFIGDCHLSSIRPGRRQDNYSESILSKISQAIDIANSRRLLPVFLGDIFHYPIEPEESIKSSLIRILRKSWTTPFSNTGNHDKAGTYLSNSDSLSYIDASGRLIVKKFSGAAVVVVLEEGIRIGLGFTPYGQEIPISVENEFDDLDSDLRPQTSIWVTHHDIAFDGAYPGAHEAHEIIGCPLVINGHMHLAKPDLWRGDTMWKNIGSLGRVSIDEANHTPQVLSVFLNLESGEMDVVYDKLKVSNDSFNMTGKLIPTPRVQKHSSVLKESLFANLLSELAENTDAATDEGVLLREELEEFMTTNLTPEPVAEIVRSLLVRVIEEQRA